MSQVTVLTGARRHREWSSEERLEILREAFSPGAVVSQVARRYDVAALYRVALVRMRHHPSTREYFHGRTAEASHLAKSGGA